MNKTRTDEQETSVSGLLKYKEVAERLWISENQVYVLKATGKLPYVQIGRSTRFDEQDITDFIRKRKRRIE